MRPTEFSADTIIALLRKQTIATLPEVMAALGPRASRRTAFRKLKDLDARTSYSHRGGYYTLDALADFDEHGLWSFAGVRFSRTGTLIATAESFVNHAEAGHFVDELDNLLAVGTQDPLRKLVGDGRLTRHKLAGQFLYCAADRAQQTHQLRARRLLMATPGLVRPLPAADLMPEELRAAIVLFASLLDERQRRLFAGLEALKCGWGGDRRIAQLLGIDPSTVAAGRRQLVERDVELDRVRRAGGGRPPTEKNAGSHRRHRSPDGPRDGRRPAQRPEVDTPHHRQGRRRIVQARHGHLQDGGSRARRRGGGGPQAMVRSVSADGSTGRGDRRRRPCSWAATSAIAHVEATWKYSSWAAGPPGAVREHVAGPATDRSGRRNGCDRSCTSTRRWPQWSPLPRTWSTTEGDGAACSMAVITRLCAVREGGPDLGPEGIAVCGGTPPPR